PRGCGPATSSRSRRRCWTPSTGAAAESDDHDMSRGRRQTAENPVIRIGTPRPPSESARADDVADVVDLGEDLVEETGETDPTPALRGPPPGAPRPALPPPGGAAPRPGGSLRGERGERHRRPTPSSSV